MRNYSALLVFFLHLAFGFFLTFLNVQEILQSARVLDPFKVTLDLSVLTVQFHLVDDTIALHFNLLHSFQFDSFMKFHSLLGAKVRLVIAQTTLL
jgi:hypothetical protein